MIQTITPTSGAHPVRGGYSNWIAAPAGVALACPHPPQLDRVTLPMRVSPNPAPRTPEPSRGLPYLGSRLLRFVRARGIPPLLAARWVSLRVLRTVRPTVRHPGVFGARAPGVEIVWPFLLVLILISPHVQLRGTGDLIFTLLAITVGGIDARRRT